MNIEGYKEEEIDTYTVHIKDERRNKKKYNKFFYISILFGYLFSNILGNTYYNISQALGLQKIMSELNELLLGEEELQDILAEKKIRYYNGSKYGSSEETNKIVDEWKYKIKKENMDEIIAEYGSLVNCFKSMGGVFSKFAGKKAHITTVGELLEYLEYVAGVLKILSVDYRGSKTYIKWYDSESRFSTHRDQWKDDALNELLINFDETGELFAINCNAGIDLAVKNTDLTNGNPIASRCPNGTNIYNEEDLRPGDVIHFKGRTCSLGMSNL